MKLTIYIFAIIATLIVVRIGYGIYSSTHVTEVTAKVTKLVDQQLIKGGSEKKVKTEMRYLIITDKETFISESSIWNWKFDNSDTFYQLEQGKTYKFKVSGLGKNLILDYRNILDATEVK